MIRIGITGPESSGKSELAEALAEILQAGLVSEYARTFLEQRNGVYTYSDLDVIAKEQWQQIVNCDPKQKIWIIDTEMLVMKIWSEYKYKTCSPYILEKLEKQPIDLYVLCKPDFPWQPDPLREHPEEREALYACYHADLIRYNLPYLIAEGSLKQRIEIVLKWINKL